jgi:hypothetical protein
MNDDETPEQTPPDSGMWADPGPGFDAEALPESHELEELGEDGQTLGWTPEQVITVLQEMQAPAFNGGVNSLLGVKKVDWHHRQKRLEVVAPAIAREWNKVPFIRSLAGTTDRALIASYLAFEYVGPKSIQVVAERKAIARRLELEAQMAANGQEIPPEPVDDGPDDNEPPHADLSDIPARRR